MNIVDQLAVGILGSLSPGVSIRVKASSSTNSGFYVTPYSESLARNAATAAPCTLLRKVDFPVPKVPRVIMLGNGVLGASTISASTEQILKKSNRNYMKTKPLIKEC